MSGLIWGALGQAVGNASSTIGNYMMRSELDEERQRERMELQRERLAATERENERNRQLRADLAAQRGGAGGGDGLGARDIGEGGADEGMLARRAGMTVPELRALRRYSETGDTKPFERDTNKVTMKDTGDPYAPDAESQVVKGLPPGFEAEARAKLQTLAKIEESYRLGGKYDDVTKGRRNQQEIDASDVAMRQPAAAGVIGQAMAAGAGKDLVGGDSNVTRNKFTGATSTTDVGKSVVSENQAQANKYNKEAETGSRAEKNKEFQGLQQERLAIDADLKRAEDAIKSLRKDTPKGWDAEVKTLQEKISRLEEDKKSVQERIRTFTQSEAERGRGSPRSGAPAPAGGGTQARRGVFNPSTGQIEWK